jgi:hypothetical protein
MNKEEVPTRTIKVNGRAFNPPKKVTIAPNTLSQKSRPYSEILKGVGIDSKNEARKDGP